FAPGRMLDRHEPSAPGGDHSGRPAPHGAAVGASMKAVDPSSSLPGYGTQVTGPRFATVGRISAYAEEEVVVDERSCLSPAEIVQARLIGLPGESSPPVSCLHSRGRPLARGRLEG